MEVNPDKSIVSFPPICWRFRKGRDVTARGLQIAPKEPTNKLLSTLRRLGKTLGANLGRLSEFWTISSVPTLVALCRPRLTGVDGKRGDEQLLLTTPVPTFNT
eukprot:jgi/Botrbrau1/17604/Bobra.0166s0041.1